MAHEGGVKVKGLGALIAKLQHLPAEVATELNTGLKVAGEIVASAARASLQRGSRGGLPYTRYNPRRSGTASAAGEAPKSDTGNLASSIVVVPHPEVGAVVIKCDSNIAPYARALEEGTMDGRLKPRPFLGPALEKNKAMVIAIVAKAVDKAVQNVR